MPPNDDSNLQYAARLDVADELRGFRSFFSIEEPELIYMDGNSLGRPSLSSLQRLIEVTHQQWGKKLIRAWGKHWYYSPLDVGNKIAHLAGAAEGQIIVSDSTSVNLFKLVMAALGAQSGRPKIISDAANFPSDLYILQGCVELLGKQHTLQLIPFTDTIHPDMDTLYQAIDEKTALVTLSHVTFKSGYLYDAGKITQRAHQAGALVLWDLSHSIGVVPIELDHWNVDLAVGCTYKYLNGGPGSPAFLYVRQELQEKLRCPIWGWFGQTKPFSFDLDYMPAEGIKRYLCGTPPILSMCTLEPAIEMILKAGMTAIRSKSINLTSFLIKRFDERLAPLGFTLGTPRQADQRGSHVSIRHPEGYRINRALIADMQVLPDFREPDNIRLGLAPLYTSFVDVWHAVKRLEKVVNEKLYLKYPTERLAIT